ncbi:MAG: sigma-70 family RNA polymerase sigma factor [Chthoniobacteraceae bacterium]
MTSPDSDSRTCAAREFHTTRWSIVVSAQGDGSGVQDALAKLCNTYWFPLYAFVRRQGMSSHDAQDLTQEFFARLLAKGWLGGVDRERGRFRSWLLASMKHFLANEWNKARTGKRGGGAVLFSFDALDAESRLRHEPATDSPEIIYDRRWATMLLDQVMARLRTEMAGAGRLAHFEALKFCLTGEKNAYAEVGARLAMSEGAVKIAVHRMRERYRTLLRAEVAETVAGPEEIEDELRALLAALSG